MDASASPPNATQELRAEGYAFNIRDVIHLLVSNALIILLGLAIGIALGLTAQKLTTPVYESTAKFVVDELPYYQSKERSDAETERQLIQTLILSIPNRDLEISISERLGVDHSQIAFTPLNPAIPLGKGRVAANIRVDAIQNSRIGRIQVTSQSPEFAAQVANAILEELRLYNILAGHLNNLRRGIDLAKDKADNLQKSLIAASEERIKIDQQNVELNAYLKEGLPLEGFTSFAKDTTLNNLKTQFVLVESEYKGLAATATRGSRLESKKAELRSLESQLKTYLGRLVTGLHSEREIATTGEADLRKEFDETKLQLDELVRAASRFSQSFGDPVSMKALAMESSAGPGGPANVIVTVDRATPGKRPVKPKLWISLLGGVVFGTALGFGLALLRVLLENKITSARGIEQVSGLHTLAMIPKYPPLSQGSKRKNVFNNPAYPSDLGFLRSRLIQLGMNNPGNTIIGFVPAEAGDHCSQLVADLAILLAQAEKRTLVIDLHLWNPRQASLLGITPQKGFADWLSFRDGIDQYISYSALRELALLAPGNSTQDLDDLLAGHPLLLALPDLLTHWDYILIDSPSILSDWSLTMTLPSKSPLIIGAAYGKTTIDALTETARKARSHDWQLLGVVLQGSPKHLCSHKAKRPAAPPA